MRRPSCDRERWNSHARASIQRAIAGGADTFQLRVLAALLILTARAGATAVDVDVGELTAYVASRDRHLDRVAALLIDARDGGSIGAAVAAVLQAVER